MTTECLKISPKRAFRQGRGVVNRHRSPHGEEALAPSRTMRENEPFIFRDVARTPHLKMWITTAECNMSNLPPAPPSLQELRKEIDAIDEQVHRLLMARGDIIDRLIRVKQTQEVGSAFRPAREASMMRELVKRHRGILPLDTIESIWRVIISTFTYVQAPFSVHADISVGES